MLSAKTISLVKSTVPLLENAGVAVTNYFYNRMFTVNPELKNIFNMSNQLNGKQQFALFSAVASYAKHIDNPSALGNQLSEHLYHQLQRLGLSVSDIKLAQQVQITPVGDFALSRSRGLDTEQQLNYVLTGTLLRDKAGVVVNVRVIQRNSKAVVATAQVYIPSFIVAAPG